MTEEIAIIQIGNPILRQQAQTIENISSPTVQKLISDLMTIMLESNGVGIAAPQIGQPYRLLIVASRPNFRYPHAPEMSPTPMVNPRIVNHSQEIIKGWEGCLSVPGVRGFVPRYQWIEVEYFNPMGQLQKQIFTDFVARIFQHEYDHFEGLVFLDRLESNLDIISEQEYQKMITNVSES
ncbi:peptide deformylase [Calothrix sp. 336/3]|uniref:peptide deformylase n=1 Tax=Calothrix sp. 336/3 TaxID=1337936 RepID=UPI0004E2E241|nr:peptide deformylase [Calothrix sp. 336/3]AKG21810.1 peptide deformylase [Calothrix sp. 336/3]